MIINNSHSDVEVIGDVKEFKTSIDPKNLEFITTLLSSNLYSDPEQSFIREIVSNAWDSHVEAGTTDIPVIVKFSKTTEGNSITIRDYGTGLSPERFNEIYRNIGSSTKRDSNDYIGCFGIGHLSPFACSNTVYITSYYNGTAYHYIGSKSSNVITYHQVGELPTDEKNGVEVTIKNIEDISSFESALPCITFFPNVFVDGTLFANTINKVKIKRFTNFACAITNLGRTVIVDKLLLGNVLYPCSYSILSIQQQDFMNSIANSGIVIKFDIGELNVTPNRENIIYNTETIKKINDRILAAKSELITLVKRKTIKDHNDIREYALALSDVTYYNPITDEVKYSKYFVFEGGFNMWSKELECYTYKGEDLREYIGEIKNVISLTLPNLKGVAYDGRVYGKKLPYNAQEYSKIGSENILILNKNARLIQSAKQYINKNYSYYGIMTDISFTDFEIYIRGWLRELLLPKCEQYDLIVRGVYDSIMSKSKKLDLENDTEFLKFKDELSKKPKDTLQVDRNIILHVWYGGSRFKYTFKSYKSAIDFIKDHKKGIILTEMLVDAALYYTIAQIKNYVFIQARKEVVDNIRKLNLTCMVDPDWLLYKDPMLSIVLTLKKHFPSGIPIESKFLTTLPLDVVKEIDYLRSIYSRHASNFTYVSAAIDANLPYDPYIENLCIKLKSYINKYKETEDIINSSDIHCGDDSVIAALLVKTKKYRVNKLAYMRAKNNKLIRILCKK